MPSPQIPQSDQDVLENNGFFTTSWFTYFQGIYKAIRSALKIKLSGVLNMNFSSASNTSTGETDLLNYTLQKDTLVNNGDLIEIEAWGIYAANANNKTVKLVFGSQTILTTGAIAANDGTWSIKGKIIRKTVSTQEIVAEILSSNSSVADSATRTAGTQDLTTDIIIKCTGTGGATNDITEYALAIKLTPYD